MTRQSLKLRRHARRRVLVGEGLRVDRLEQARALEIGRQHLRDLRPDLTVAAGEVRERDRQRLDVAARDVDVQLGARRERYAERGESDPRARGAAGDGEAHVMSLGSKVMVKVCHRSYLSGGSLSGWHVGLRSARKALSAAAWKNESPS